MSAASVTLPLHFVDATRDAIRAYSHGAASDAGTGRSSRSSSSNAGSTTSRRSSGASTKSNTSSAARKASSFRSRLSGSSVKAPVVETLYSGSASGRTTPSGQSLASSASTGTQPSWLTKSNDWTTTGNSTDRSSVFSLGDWGEDEFDRAATRKVKSLFEDVDSWMFEQDNRVEGSLSQTSRMECVEWVDKFIHCRTLGTQLLAPKDAVGYEMVTADAALLSNRPATGSILIDVTENDELTAAIPDLSAYSLCLSGKAMRTIEVSPSASVVGEGAGGSSSGGLKADMSHLVEEIFEQDGKIEEYLAYDSRKFYSSALVVSSSSSSSGGKLLPHRQQLQHLDSSRSNYSKRRHYNHSHHHQHSQPPYRLEKSGLPPITPTGCMRDSIISGLFDLLWSSYITWIQHVLQRYHASLVNEIVYKQLKSGVGLTSRSTHDHALLAKTGVDNPYNRLVMTTNLRRTQTDYGSERIGSGHASGGAGGSGVLSSQSSASSFITSVPVVGMVGVGLDSVVRPSSRLSTLTSRYTSFNVGQPDMTTLDGVLTISSKALHYQHKQQQQQQPPMTPSSHHRAASSLGTHSLHLQQPQHQLYNHLENHNNSGGNNVSSAKTFSGSVLQADDHLIHESLSSQTPIHVVHSVHPNNSSGSSSMSLRGLTSSAAGHSPSFHHPRGQVTSIATISLTNSNAINSSSNNQNSIVPSSSALGHHNNNNRNHHNNFRSVESTPPSTSFLGANSARASAIGQRGRSRTHLQPLDRAKTPVISGCDENDPLAASGGGLNISNVSIGLEMVRGIGIVNSSSPPLGMPRNLPPLEADANISNSRLGHHGGSSKRKNTVRASSAISDKNPRNVTSGTLKNRALRGIGTGRDVGTPGGGTGVDDRPNTTHTFRSDLVYGGGGGGGGGAATSLAANRRPLSPPDGTNRHSRSGSTATTSQPPPPQQQPQQTTGNNTAMGFGVVGQFEDKPIMLTGISLTPFNAHPLESMLHHHPSEEDEDLFVGGGGAVPGLRSGSGEDPTWNQIQPNRVSKSPGSQRLTNSGLALKSRGRLGPFS